MNDVQWTWWKHGVIYQIYPRSFYDSNNDGIGDIPGIIEKLEYLQELGIDAIWLSPINRSPMHDFGYDVSNYREIDPVFGTKKDFKELISRAHKRNIRVIMDMVMNHTSYQHKWFQSSRISRKSPKRDWYIWHDGKNGGPPNNWRSAFGGSAWTWDELTCQYYLHSFLEEQPDVNWRNNELRDAMFSEMQYWLEKGIDGFRFDVINWFIKDKHFRDNSFFHFLPLFNSKRYDRNRKGTHKIIRELRRVIDEYNDRMTVGEVFTFPPGDPVLSAGFLGNGTDELHLAFDFSLMYRPWNARTYYRVIKHWYNALPEQGWPCNVLSNHDQPRSISRLSLGISADDAEKRARVAAVMLLTLKGTPFIYYGEEIGMRSASIDRKHMQDPVGKRMWPFFPGRDMSRTPMQWNSKKNAGFTSGNPWLPLSPDYSTLNVDYQVQDKDSLFNFYKRLIAVRKRKKSLMFGDWRPHIKGHRGVFAYRRKWQNEIIYVFLNFSSKPKSVALGKRAQWRVLISTHLSVNYHFSRLDFTLAPYEATVIEKIGNL